MVQVIPSDAGGLASAAETFAAGLEKYMRPNHDFQIAMQKAIGGNPQLAQSLADLEYNAPGTLDRMGFGDLGRVISQVPESPDSQFRRENRGEILSTEKAKLQTESAGYGFDLERLNDTIDYLKKAGPDVKADVALRKLGLKTQGEQALESSTTDRNVAEKKRLDAEQPVVEDEAALKHKALQDVIDNYPALHGMDPVNMVRSMLAGKSVPELQSYLNMPGGAQAYSHAQAIVEFQQREDDRKIAQANLDEYRSARLDARKQQMSAEEKQNIIQAGAALRSSGRAGTLTAWRTVLEHPDQVEAIRQQVKANPKVDLSQDQKDVLAAANAQQEMQDRLDSRTVKEINFNVRSAHNAASEAVRKNESPAAIDLALVPLNNVLAEQNRKTGQTYMAKYGPMPDIGHSEPGSRLFGMRDAAPGLYYVNGDGKRVADTEPLAGLVLQSSQAKMDAKTLAFVTQYKAANAVDQKFNLEKLQKENPDLYANVIKIINKK